MESSWIDCKLSFCTSGFFLNYAAEKCSLILLIKRTLSPLSVAMSLIFYSIDVVAISVSAAGVLKL